ncbi:aldehyde ferredoxin oxidoreductase family protein [Candidatus Bathyarchaeota archaeon]|nr:aldehyde ferredoxin oxidoreductase family protein [Candidatus Bathyarchaeota archaeon]
MGKILRIDLTKKKLYKENLCNELAEKFLGGPGFCTHILYDETGPETDPLGLENRLVFTVGPLSGTAWPQSGRYEVGAKSPLTGILGGANSGGKFGPQMKRVGYDAIILQGRASKPVYVYVEDGEAKIVDAKHLWGKDTDETMQVTKEEHGKKTEVACIGQGGENLVRYAGIITDRFRLAARSGLGAVMGSKNLKALALNGNLPVEVANSERFLELVALADKRIKSDPFVPEVRKYGTTILVSVMNEIGRFPVRNFQTGVFPTADKISGEELVEKYKIRDKACAGCRIACKNVIEVKSGRFKGMILDHPEYETLSVFGGRVGNDDLDSIIDAHILCNLYGIDVISTGGVIAFIMELHEKKIIDEKDTGGIAFKWGDKDLILDLIRKIAHREGIGNLLAEGTKRVAEQIGRGTEKYAMHVKGLDIPAQDGRAQKSMGLAHAVSTRGADHLRASAFLDEIGFEKAIERRFGKEYLPEMADRLDEKYKGIMVKVCEDFAAVVSSLGLCLTGGYAYPPIFFFRDLADAVSAATGMKATERTLRTTGERIVNLQRAYNIREGLSRKDDRLPSRFLEEPIPDGPCKGQTVNLEAMLDEYYKTRGWDVKTGLIPKEKLGELGLKNVSDELEQMGKLPPKKL